MQIILVHFAVVAVLALIAAPLEIWLRAREGE